MKYTTECGAEIDSDTLPEHGPAAIIQIQNAVGLAGCIEPWKCAMNSYHEIMQQLDKFTVPNLKLIWGDKDD